MDAVADTIEPRHTAVNPGPHSEHIHVPPGPARVIVHADGQQTLRTHPTLALGEAQEEMELAMPDLREQHFQQPRLNWAKDSGQANRDVLIGGSDGHQQRDYRTIAITGDDNPLDTNA
jgi:hypothetical protein